MPNGYIVFTFSRFFFFSPSFSFLYREKNILKKKDFAASRLATIMARKQFVFKGGLMMDNVASLAIEMLDEMQMGFHPNMAPLAGNILV